MLLHSQRHELGDTDTEKSHATGPEWLAVNGYATVAAAATSVYRTFAVRFRLRMTAGWRRQRIWAPLATVAVIIQTRDVRSRTNARMPHHPTKPVRRAAPCNYRCDRYGFIFYFLFLYLSES